MTNVNSGPLKMKGYALVRDAEGRPLFDDYNQPIPKPILDMLTEEDMKYIKEQKNVTNSH